MKKYIEVCCLIFVFTVQLVLAQSNSNGQYNLYDQDGLIIDTDQSQTIRNHEIFVLGEYSKFKGEKMVGFQLFKQLYENNNVKLWVVNESPVYEYYLKKYIKTKEEYYKKKLIKLKYTGLRKTEAMFIDSVSSFFERNQGSNLEIISFNLSLENETNMYRAIIDIIKTKGDAPKSIEPTIKDLKEIANNKSVAPPSYKVDRIMRELEDGVIEHKEDYETYFEGELDILLRILKIHYIVNENYRLNDYSIEYLAPRFDFCSVDIENAITSNGNSNVFIQQEIPWISNYSTKNNDGTVVNYLETQLTKMDKFEIVTIGRLRPELIDKNCENCSLGFKKSEVKMLQDEMNYSVSLFKVKKPNIDFVIITKD